MASHFYTGQGARAFWKSTVAGRHSLDIDDWYRRKFQITGKRIATAGSCFAQHIGRALRENNFRYVDMEPAPDFLAPEDRLAFGYGMYSARYGNVYTARQLLQLFRRALGEFAPRAVAWRHAGGVVDPFRPTIEPTPYVSEAEMLEDRAHHLRAVAALLENCDVFVFTLGLTETWVDREDGAAFPVAPGVSGGDYDPARHACVNMGFQAVHDDMVAFFGLARGVNPRMRFLLTVSPVPLAATAGNDHVVVATSHSKAVLRAVAGELAASLPYVDYFPSFEIISSPVMRAQFYEPDMRGVSAHGVAHVMKQFFRQHEPPKLPRKARPKPQAEDDDDVWCDEELLNSEAAQ